VTSAEEAGSDLGGDFLEGYRLVKAETVTFDRSHRGRLLVSGRAPGQMLGGVLTGRIPGPLSELTGSEVARGSRAYSAMLTPKGKMLSDLYVYRLPGEAEAFLIDVPAAGLESVRDHFAKVLPPRLARVQDASSDFRFTTFAGPGAAGVVAKLVGMETPELSGLSGDDVVVVGGIIIGRSADLSVPSFDVLIPTDRWDALSTSLAAAGVGSAGTDVWHSLRLEAGTPEFGLDMDAETIPVEAGIDERAIDHDKGCYTGQEVIIRIRHRGRVNKHLRTLTLTGPDVVPGHVASRDIAHADLAPGAALFLVGEAKAVGSITSVAPSPDVGGMIALGYVRREVEPRSEVLVGGQDGPRAKVLERGSVA